MHSVFTVFLLTFFTSLITNPVTFACAPEYRPRCCPGRTIKYVFGSQKVNWWRAHVLCKQAGMELASITTKEEQRALEYDAKVVGAKVGLFEGYWLAGFRNGVCDTDFVWITTGNPIIYRKFDSGQPDNFGGAEFCLEFFLPTLNSSAWNDLHCNIKLGFICQKREGCC